MSRSALRNSTMSKSLLAAVTVVALAGCAGPTEESSDPAGSSSSPAADDSRSPSPSEESSSPAASRDEPSEEPSEQAGPSLEVSVKGEEVSPNAAELSVKTGEPIAMTITANRAGELHVHSKPEQYVEFEAGTTTKKLVITTPGTVEIEEHDTEAVVAVVEVTQ